jgi:uncharacterized LabA/DUF88 family protein
VKNAALVRVYIDGFNLYHAIAAMKDPTLKWLNMWKLSESFLRSGETLDAVNFYTAVLNWQPDKQIRHRNYIAAQQAVGVTVHESNFKKSTRRCVAFDRNCKFYEEKQTDVAIAVSLTADALMGKMGRAVLITADSDQIPTAKFLQTVPGVRLSLIFPPGRKALARDLGGVIQDRHELTKGQLLTCRLPRTVLNGNGTPVAHMPSMYSTGSRSVL